MKLIEARQAWAMTALNWCHIAQTLIDLLIDLPADIKINIICIGELGTKVGLVWFLEYSTIRKRNRRIRTSHLRCVNAITSCIALQFRTAGTFYVPVNMQLEFELKMQLLGVVVRSRDSHDVAMFRWHKYRRASCGRSIPNNLFSYHQ